MTPAAQLAQGLLTLGIELAPTAEQRLLDYLALLAKWNRTYRLTAVDQPSLAVSHHLLDSLILLRFVEAPALLDVGSGGGLPGIPLAIARPGLRVVLLEANGKKAAFLRQAAIELKLRNVAVHCGRVETYQPDSAFALIVARAFADLPTLVALSRHLLAADGHWLAMKGICPQAEMAHLPAGVQVDGVHRVVVPGLAGERHVIMMSTSQAQH